MAEFKSFVMNNKAFGKFILLFTEEFSHLS